MAQKWTLSDISDLSDKTAIITGGNTGLGLKTALELARRGAEVVIGSRSPENGQAAVASIISEIPGASISYCQLELTDYASIDAFATAFLDRHDRLDILLHNAGLVIHPVYELAPTGRELQMQINHLGHFALACALMPLVTKTQGSRVVQSTTVPYHKGKIDFDDFDWAERKYKPMQAYFDSRTAQILFAYKLNEKFKRAGISAKAISMQPGLVKTEGLKNSDFGGWIMKALAQPLETGCRTHLRVCTDTAIDTEHFWEPRFKIMGEPTPKQLKAPALDAQMASRLLARSEELTGTKLKIGSSQLLR
jgi:NAD(P)-dependent dehydrogenase (short-subunit alcohol dehydrogenase family)